MMYLSFFILSLSPLFLWLVLNDSWLGFWLIFSWDFLRMMKVVLVVLSVVVECGSRDS